MAKHLRITGRVQGVAYRASFQARAEALQLSGWVRNRLDGSVEAMVAGETQALEIISAWAKHGPALARVDQVLVSEADDVLIQHDDFRVLPTA